MHASLNPFLNHIAWNPGVREHWTQQEAVNNLRPPMFHTGVTPGVILQIGTWVSHVRSPDRHK